MAREALLSLFTADELGTILSHHPRLLAQHTGEVLRRCEQVCGVVWRSPYSLQARYLLEGMAQCSAREVALVRQSLLLQPLYFRQAFPVVYENEHLIVSLASPRYHTAMPCHARLMPHYAVH